MKPRLLPVVIVCTLVVIVLFITRAVYHDIARVTWQNHAEAGIKYLAEGIERYKRKYDSYPSSIQELIAGSDAEWSNYMRQHVFNDQFADKYEYQLQTNRFAIRVIRPAKWYMKGETVERIYKAGEALVE